MDEQVNPNFWTSPLLLHLQREVFCRWVDALLMLPEALVQTSMFERMAGPCVSQEVCHSASLGAGFRFHPHSMCLPLPQNFNVGCSAVHPKQCVLFKRAEITPRIFVGPPMYFCIFYSADGPLQICSTSSLLAEVCGRLLELLRRPSQCVGSDVAALFLCQYWR